MNSDAEAPEAFAPLDQTLDLYDETFDPDAVPALLAPRLAVYAAPSPVPVHDHDDDDGSQGYVATDADGNEEEAPDPSLQARPPPEMIVVETDEPATADNDADEETFDYYFGGGGGDIAVDDEDADDGDFGADEGSENEEDREEGDERDGLSRSSGHEDYTAAFPVSRVKDLLRYEGSSTIISRDACLTASEAVALILRDMAKAAAAEAQRRNRKTVNYDDVAKTVHLFDRFAYLAEVVPAVAASPLGTHGSGTVPARSVVIGTGASRGTKEQRQQQQRPLGVRGSPAHKERAKPVAAKKSKAVLAPPPASHGTAHPMIPRADAQRQTRLRF